MRPNQLALIALTLAIASLSGCGGSSSSSATTVVSTFLATDTATVTAPANSLNGFAFMGAAAVSGVPSTVTLGLNPSGLPLTATVSGVKTITVPSLTSGTTGYSGNTLFTPTTTGTTNFSGNLFATTVSATSADTSPGLRHTNFGEWQLLPPPGSTPDTFYVQEYAGGNQLTPASGVPAAPNLLNYSGTEAAIGFNSGATLPDECIISTGGSAAPVLISFNFGTNSFSGTIPLISSTYNKWTAAGCGAFNSLALNGTITPSTSSFTGTVAANGDVLVNPSNLLALPASTNGTVSGKFYGPAGNEVSGIYQLTATTSNGPVIIIGSFGAKQ